MSTQIREEIIVGRQPTAFEREQTEWAERAVAGSTAVIQEGLRHLVTLATALLAGSAALLGRTTLPGPVLTLCAVLLTGALAVSLWGSLPVEQTLDCTRPAQIAAARERLRVAKGRCLLGAAGLLMLTAVVLVGGFLATIIH